MKPINCSRCLLSTDVPGVQVDDDNICSVCRDYDKKWGDWEKNKGLRLTKLEDILDKARKKKRTYDVLVPLSGGRDSTYVLYLCRKRFNLKCLAVTWDNGFLSEHARKNIRNACQILGVDHLSYGLNRNLLMRLYRFFFLKTGFFCPVCMRGIQVALSRAQLGYNIPLTIRGSSGRTEEYIHSSFFLPGNLSFLENVLRGTQLGKEASALLFPVGTFSSPPAIQLPNYIDWDYRKIYETITGELGWKAHAENAEHSDCIVHDIVNYFRYRKFPALVPEMLRFSKLVSCGQLTREEAQRRVEKNRKEIREPIKLPLFLDELGITREEMEGVLIDPLQHMKYLKRRSRAWRRLRALKHHLLP